MLIFGQGLPFGMRAENELDSSTHGHPALLGCGSGNFKSRLLEKQSIGLKNGVFNLFYLFHYY